MKKLIKKVHNFLKNIKPEDRVAILHHSDADGICSAVITAKIIERIRSKRIDLRLNSERARVTINHDHIKELKKNNITKLITVDCCVDQEPETVKEVEKFSKILIIDHHKLYNDLNSKKIILIKPKLLKAKDDGATYCVSKLIYDLSPIEIKDLDWISVTGIFGDMNQKRWNSFVSSVFKKYKLKKNKDDYKTILGKISNLLDYASILREDETAFWKVYSAKNPTELFKLVKEYSKVEREINYWVKNYKKLAEFHSKQNLIFYEIEPKKYPVKSIVVSYLGEKHPHTTIIGTQISGKEVTLSARRVDSKVKMNNLLEKAIKGLPHASAGGHIPAAGGVIRKEDLPEFKRRIIKLLCRRV